MQPDTGAQPPRPPARGRTARRSLGAALAMALASCAPAPDRTASRVLEEVLESHRASIASLDAAPAATRPLPSAPTSNAPAGRGAPGSVSSLLGQSREGVIAVLGPPTRRRPEGEAEIWLYQGPNCALDVVLYRENRTPRVAWAAARASGTQRRTEAGCLSELVSG